MPSFQDSAVIFFLALLLFGPKKLPELARQLGKLMGEFRRASNEFRIQMEDELRSSEQAEKQKQIAAMEAAAPATPVLNAHTNTIAAPASEPETAQTIADSIADPLDTHPHMAPPNRHTTLDAPPAGIPAPLPIATSGDLSLMPPATGLPVARSSTLPYAAGVTPNTAGATPNTTGATPNTTDIPSPTTASAPASPEIPNAATESSTLAPLFDSFPQVSEAAPSSLRQHTPAAPDEAVTHG